MVLSSKIKNNNLEYLVEIVYDLFIFCLVDLVFVTASGEPPLLLAASVHCATRDAIAAARKELHCCGSGSSSPSFFELEVPAIMPVVKELCGLDNVEKYLETLVGSK